jgi:hypothetical protein
VKSGLEAPAACDVTRHDATRDTVALIKYIISNFPCYLYVTIPIIISFKIIYTKLQYPQIRRITRDSTTITSYITLQLYVYTTAVLQYCSTAVLQYQIYYVLLQYIHSVTSSSSY